MTRGRAVPYGSGVGAPCLFRQLTRRTLFENMIEKLGIKFVLTNSVKSARHQVETLIAGAWLPSTTFR